MRKTNKQIETEYAKMLKQFNETVEADKVNCYECDHCKNVMKTIEVDTGVTPMYISCNNCGWGAKSTFYKDILCCQEPSIEWYRPSLEQVMKMHRRKQNELVEHILQGGLHIRPRKTGFVSCCQSKSDQ